MPSAGNQVWDYFTLLVFNAAVKDDCNVISPRCLVSDNYRIIGLVNIGERSLMCLSVSTQLESTHRKTDGCELSRV